MPRSMRKSFSNHVAIKSPRPPRRHRQSRATSSSQDDTISSCLLREIIATRQCGEGFIVTWGGGRGTGESEIFKFPLGLGGIDSRVSRQIGESRIFPDFPLLLSSRYTSLDATRIPRSRGNFDDGWMRRGWWWFGLKGRDFRRDFVFRGSPGGLMIHVAEDHG